MKTPLVKALELAITSMERLAHDYEVRAGAARFGLDYGIKAKQHWDEYQEAIKIFRSMLNNINSNSGQ